MRKVELRSVQLFVDIIVGVSTHSPRIGGRRAGRGGRDPWINPSPTRGYWQFLLMNFVRLGIAQFDFNTDTQAGTESADFEMIRTALSSNEDVQAAAVLFWVNSLQRVDGQSDRRFAQFLHATLVDLFFLTQRRWTGHFLFEI